MKVACGRGLPELPPRDKWPIRFLLASEELWAIDVILKQIKDRPLETKRQVLPAGLSGLLLYRLWQHGLYVNQSWDRNPKCFKHILPSEITDNNVHNRSVNNHSRITLVDYIVPTLETQRLKDLAVVAQRKQTLTELNNQAELWGVEESDCFPILMKGSSTSILCYPDETLRLSGDIDILMNKKHITTFMEGLKVDWFSHHPGCRELLGFIVEGHQCLSPFQRDTDCSSFQNVLQKTPNFCNLASFCNEMICNVAANHMIKHCADTPYDLIDLSFTMKKGVDAEKAFALAHRYNMVHTLYSCILLMSRLGEPVEDYLAIFEKKLSCKDKKYGIRLLKLLFVDKSDFIMRRESLYHRSLLKRQPYFSYLIRDFICNISLTEKETGLSPYSFKFLLAHTSFIFKRLYRFLKSS